MFNFSFHLIYFHKPSIPQLARQKQHETKQNTCELYLHATGHVPSSPQGLSVSKRAGQTELCQQLAYPLTEWSHTRIELLFMANTWFFLARYSCVPWVGAGHADVAYFQQFSNWFIPLLSTSLRETLQWPLCGPYWGPNKGSPSLRSSLGWRLPRSTVRSSGLHRLLMEYLHRSPNYLHWGRSESLCQPGYSLSGEAGRTEAPSGTEPNPR